MFNSWYGKLKSALSKTGNNFTKKVLTVFGANKIDATLYENLETVLLENDLGIHTTTHILNLVRNKVSLKGLKNSDELQSALKESLIEILKKVERPLTVENNVPFVIMVAGVNGVGKTTTIGKLVNYYKNQGKRILLAAGDTFRAGAVEQLDIWAKRNGIDIIMQTNADPSAICFDAINSAISKKIDIVILDTAGRLPTQLNLMEEIKKIKRVANKALQNAPHEILLVLDANIGQNSIQQVKAFNDALGITGLVISKLDGTAKGGVIFSIANEYGIPIRFIGIGETIEDIRPFNANDFLEALFA